jgi:hypothetical protein
MNYKKFILIILAFQSYTQAAPKGSLVYRFENTIDQKEKHTLKEWINFLKNNTIDPDTTISVSWSDSNNIIQRCAYHTVYGDYKIAIATHRKIDILKQHGIQSTGLTSF